MSVSQRRRLDGFILRHVDGGRKADSGPHVRGQIDVSSHEAVSSFVHAASMSERTDHWSRWLKSGGLHGVADPGGQCADRKLTDTPAINQCSVGYRACKNTSPRLEIFETMDWSPTSAAITSQQARPLMPTVEILYIEIVFLAYRQLIP